MDKFSPKLRTVNKTRAAYPLNEFPVSFPYTLGREIVYLLASKGKSSLEGPEWEEIFAKCIDADWKPSNVGLDDVVKGNTAWGAKTIKASNPVTQKQVRLISGRNSPTYSFGENINRATDPNIVGELVLNIWNERVSSIREKYKHLRTIVLVKSDDLGTVVVFEFDTIRYDPELYQWQWNKNGNLVGIERSTGNHRFTWQPHGSQFTILETVPDKRLILKIRRPPRLDQEQILKSINFDDSWITVLKDG